jgi:Uma2 family endonuclease
MPDTAEKLMSLDEFLPWEREQSERYEDAGGVITMMTGASLAHLTVTMNVASALRQTLRGTGCRPFANDAKVLAGGSVRYPDIKVTCTPFSGSDDIVPEPVLVIEVISPRMRDGSTCTPVRTPVGPMRSSKATRFSSSLRSVSK